MRRFFVKQPTESEDAVILTGEDAKHISAVLRLKPGTRIALFDGTGMDYHAEIISASPQRVAVSIIERLACETESPLQITVAQGFLKEKKMDGLLRPLTELGVRRWIPFFAERSVPRPSDHRLSTRMARWQKIARESLKQCRRGCSPDIGPVMSFKEMIAVSMESEFKIAFWEKAAKPIPEAFQEHGGWPVKKVFILLGPEGGFSGHEIAEAEASGFKAVTLGPRILRAETATLAACSLIQYLLGDMGGNPGSH